MPLTLMYITNEPDIAQIAENAGIDRIFVDLETIGKEERQHNMDTVKSSHTVADIRKVKRILGKAELLVRINKIHTGSEKEIQEVIRQGADIIMLPYFKTVEEVKIFLGFTAGRVKTDLLVETPEAVECLDQILALEGIDEIHVGINDLHLGYHRKFMFELLADGTVEKICEKADKCGLKYGFGGIARIGCGELPAERIIREHYRLGSTKAIVSRSFCDTGKITDRDEIRWIFDEGIAEIRALEKEVAGEKEQENSRYFEENRREVIKIVDKIIGKDAGGK